LKNYLFDPSEEMRWQDPQFKAKVDLEFLSLYLFPGQVLNTVRVYSQEYLSYLKNNFNINSQISPLQKDALAENRWFLTQNLFLNQQWNSKIYLHRLFKKMNIYPHQRMVNSLHEIRQMISQFKKVYVKSDFGFAGIGNKMFDTQMTPNEEKWCDKNLSRGLIVEPFYDKKQDFSIYLKGTEEKFYYNNVSIDGRYLGTVYDRKQSLDQFLEKLTLEKRNEFRLFFKNVLGFIPAEVLKLGLVFDCFFYELKGELHAHLSEVSFRLTMGRSMLQIIDNLRLDGEVFEFFAEENIHLKQADKFFELAQNSLNREKIVFLSDEFNQKTYKIKKIR
jgi:hypothetical protein